MSPWNRIGRSNSVVRGSAATPTGPGPGVSSYAAAPVGVNVSADVGGSFNTQATAFLVLVLAGLVLLGRISLR